MTVDTLKLSTKLNQVIELMSSETGAETVLQIEGGCRAAGLDSMRELMCLSSIKACKPIPVVT